jgi:hypothetical protein
MPAPAFAALETSLAAATLGAFENIRLSTGSGVFGAVLDRAVDTVGEFGLSGDPRDRITVLRAEAANFTPGMPLAADPATYSVTERLAMPRASWHLDRMANDDGHVQIWWLK